MSKTPKACKTPDACWDWLTEAQFLELAREAYRFTVLATHHHADGAWESQQMRALGCPAFQCYGSTRESFAENLSENLTGALDIHAASMHLAGFDRLAKSHHNYQIKLQTKGGSIAAQVVV